MLSKPSLCYVGGMPQDLFGNHSFDPAALKVLRAVFDTVWNAVASKTNAGNAVDVREAIAVSLIDLGKAGQIDPDQLERYATSKAMEALNSAARAG